METSEGMEVTNVVINTLTNEKNKYQEMKVKINNIIEELTNAKNYISSSQDSLKSAYFSSTLSDKTSSYEEILQEIIAIKDNLNNTILLEIDSYIAKLEEEIEEEKREMQLL